jgi:hypothetical protein
VVLLAVGVVAVAVFVSRPRWEPSCRHGGDGATARAAVDDYDDGCRSDVHVVDLDEVNGGASAREFSIDRDGLTRFVVVGQDPDDGRWHVIEGEYAGP